MFFVHIHCFIKCEQTNQLYIKRELSAPFPHEYRKYRYNTTSMCFFAVYKITNIPHITQFHLQNLHFLLLFSTTFVASPHQAWLTQPAQQCIQQPPLT